MEQAEARRALALDALRGFAILTMILSSRIPYGVLPGWMYHAQVPPPLHKFNPAIPGISWVDLVFPFFLFSMGAAFPFALSRRKTDGTPMWKVTWQIVWRGLLLMFFAVSIMHARPHSFDPALGTNSLLLALLLFGFMFLFFMRYPAGFSAAWERVLKLCGLAGLLVFMAIATYPNGSGFLITRFDIIILVLSNVAIIGSLIWLLTPGNFIARIGIMALLFGIRLSNGEEGSWIHSLSLQWPGGWLFQLNFLKYLFIVIPGTMAGDLILSWMNASDGPHETSPLPKLNAGLFAFMMFFIQLVLLTGLYGRWLPQTFIAALLILSFSFYLIKGGTGTTGKLFRQLLSWGSFWLLLGFALESFEGGIKKDHSTMSYYFMTSGMALFMLLGFSTIIDVFKKKGGITGLLAANGQNPMLAYAAGTNLLTPLVLLTYIDQGLHLLLPGPWPGVLKGILVTLLLAVLVSTATRYKVFWRT